jgi:hypothetical protein
VETGYTSIIIILNRMYKNSTLVKFWREFEIDIKEEKIRLRPSFQLQIMKETIKIEQTFIKMNI